MFVTCVYVDVKPEYIDDFIRATTANHTASVQEPGNLRFDLLQCCDEPNRFLIYEAYESEEAAAAHKTTPHYLTWRDTVAAWMAQPRQGVKYTILQPLARDQW